jgi:periplasmic protein TonB
MIGENHVGEPATNGAHRLVWFVTGSTVGHVLLVALVASRLAAMPVDASLFVDLIAPPAATPGNHADAGAPSQEPSAPLPPARPPIPHVAAASADHRVASTRPARTAESTPAPPRTASPPPPSTVHPDREPPVEQPATTEVPAAVNEKAPTAVEPPAAPIPTALAPRAPAVDGAAASPRLPLSEESRTSSADAASSGEMPRRSDGVAGRSITSAVVSRSATGAPVTPPRPLQQTAPRYPESAQRAEVQGTTLVRLLVMSDGTVTNAVVQRSSGHQTLDAAALEAVKRWRFEPARRGGEPIDLEVTLPIRFSLQ